MNDTPANAIGAYVVSDHIRYTEASGCIVILDCRSGQYEVADEIASKMWDCLLGNTSPADLTRRWTAEYGMTATSVADELRGFAEKCERDGLLRRYLADDDSGDQNTTATVRSLPRLVPRILVALYFIAHTTASLSSRKFSGTYRHCATALSSTGEALPEKPIRTFVRAENVVGLWRSVDDCLVRSLSLFRYLRACGVPAEHVIGVRRIPFAAHAWVEVAGLPVLDYRVEDFTPIARLAG